MANSKKSGRSRLNELTIRNLGVIEEAAIEFAPGLNVLTGETGAGKTMVVTALSLIAGGKTDSDLIRLGCERLSVAGTFALPERPKTNLENLLSEHDPEIEDDSIILTRTITREGKSKASLSGAPTTSSTLASFASELIEIHGQHGALALTKGSRQRDLLDNFSGDRALDAISKYQVAYENFREIRRRLFDLNKSESSRFSKIQELEQLLKDAAKLQPKIGEFEDLERKIALSENVEELRINLGEVVSTLSAEEIGALVLIDRARKALNALSAKDERFLEQSKRADSAFFDLSDLANESATLLESFGEDLAPLDDLLTRKAALRNFAKKYGGDGDLAEQLPRALERAKAAKNEIADLSGGEERVAALKSELNDARKELLKAAKFLSDVRVEAAVRLTTAVNKEIAELAMPNARFACEVSAQDNPKDEDFDATGINEISMKFSAHQNGELLPISKAASGGELSRLMLAIEVVAAGNSPLGTYLFDEVDSGIGGKAALEVGKRLKKLALDSQVIVVTHLPQVAIWADRHLIVNKDSSGSISESSISIATGLARESEIARMLSGISDSEHAQEHARELLDLGKA
ncbi:MAG: DNA repair protein RecN [Actinomycetales bacterium]|nr:DNA repair protein RecN [Actinomycetales bacterium]